MKILNSYFYPTKPTYFTTATNYSGNKNNPIYFAMGKNSLNDKLVVSNLTIKYIFCSQIVVDNETRDRLLSPVYPIAIIKNADNSG